MPLEEKILKLIDMNNNVFLQHRYGHINRAYEDEAKALAEELTALDTDGSIAQRLADASRAFIAEEYRLHPPGTVDPYADINPASFDGECTMTRARLLELLDADVVTLVNDIGISLFDKMEADNELNGPEIPVFVLWLWNNEMLNGGLCQFFVNDSAYAALVPAALEAAGAAEYAALLCDFVEKHGIDLEDLSAFKLDIESDEEDFHQYTDVFEQYPFDDFDAAYYELYDTNPIEGKIADYIREHIDAFAVDE